MRMVQTSIIAGIAFFFSAGICFGAEMGDLDLTIRVIESDDLTEMHNELSLPVPAADAAREHAEGEDSRGLNRANEARDEERENAAAHETRDEREDEIENHDDAREDKHDLNEERDEATEQENHEKEHDENPDASALGG